jgi:hypothetical protein
MPQRSRVRVVVGAGAAVSARDVVMVQKYVTDWSHVKVSSTRNA